MNEENDDISYVVLGHDYEDISRVSQCMKWICLGFIVICIGVVVLCVLL
jgi:hypothetical protein